jgi:hypothetical protein
MSRQHQCVIYTGASSIHLGDITQMLLERLQCERSEILAVVSRWPHPGLYLSEPEGFNPVSGEHSRYAGIGRISRAA